MRGSDPKPTAEISKGREGRSHPQIHLTSQITVGSEEKIENCLLQKQARVPASTPSPAMMPRVWSSWHPEESWEFADKQLLLSGNSYAKEECSPSGRRWVCTKAPLPPTKHPRRKKRNNLDARCFFCIYDENITGTLEDS